jgi:hypothetical protein
MHSQAVTTHHQPPHEATHQALKQPATMVSSSSPFPTTVMRRRHQPRSAATRLSLPPSSHPSASPSSSLHIQQLMPPPLPLSRVV